MMSNTSSFDNSQRESAATTTSSTRFANLFSKKNLESWKPTKRQLIKAFIILIYLIVGCVFYYYYEGWHPSTSVSFAVVTMTTVGYGYHHPTDDMSRLFTIFYLIFGVYYIFFSFAGGLSKRLERAAAYISTVTDADSLFNNYNYHKRMMAYNIVAIALCVILGGVVLTALEDWTLIEGIYFALETSSTVGYGDLTIKHNTTHIFLGGYIIFSTVLLSFAFNNFQMLRAQKKQLSIIEKMKLKEKDLFFLEGLDVAGNGITQEQFILSILQHLGKVDFDTDIEPWMKKFNDLRPDQNGKVYKKTLHDFSVRQSSITPFVTSHDSPASVDSAHSSIRGSFAVSFSSILSGSGGPFFPSGKKEITTTTQKEIAMRTSNVTKDDLNASLVDNQI